ncbi:hypothetical protein [Petrachloros mirabilis]
MNHALRLSVWFPLGLALLTLFTTGCAGTNYGWTVRTTSTTLSPSVEPAKVMQGTFAVLTPLSVASLRGNEAGMGQYLGDVINEVAPNLRVVDERQAISLINKQGLAEEYARMRSELELTHILDRDVLQKIGAALNVNYVFQPRLAYFSQEMLDRWEIPAINVKFARTRSSTMRLSLQLWDSESGELLWSSTAESSFQSEAVNLDPVFIEDAARVTFGSMLSDLLNRKTSSKYNPLNQALNLLIRQAVPQPHTNVKSESRPDQESSREQQGNNLGHEK